MADGPATATDDSDDEPPRLSLVVLQWDQEELTRACVDTLRAHTDVAYELIIVDNGSAPGAVAYAREAADVAVCNGENLGFGGGMNAGLEVARGQYVAFCNNDTEFPPRWASRLLEAADAPGVGMVVPAVTQAGNRRTVLDEPGDEVEVLAPFLGVPAGVVVLMPTDVARGLGGYGADEFPIASGEDLDLTFKVWCNDLEIRFDQRVLVEHVGHATADAKIEDRTALWDANRERFFTKWLDPTSHVPRLPGVPEERFAANRRIAVEATSVRKQWLDTKLALRDTRAQARRLRRALRQCREELAAARGETSEGSGAGVSRRWRRRVRTVLPDPVVRAARRRRRR